jgi:hypothetical protein
LQATIGRELWFGLQATVGPSGLMVESGEKGGLAGLLGEDLREVWESGWLGWLRLGEDDGDLSR